MSAADAGGTVSTFSIRLHITHPSIDPAEITRTLGLSPSGTQRAGDRIVWPNGRVLRSRWPSTIWHLVERYYDDFTSSDEGAYASRVIDERLKAVLEPLLAERAFVRRLTAEGEAALGLGFPGQFYVGLVIEPEILVGLAELRIGFSIEIFPNSAT